MYLRKIKAICLFLVVFLFCCPADARIFGDLDDPDSEIFKLRREQTAHVLMEDMGTRPQVFYVN